MYIYQCIHVDMYSSKVDDKSNLNSELKQLKQVSLLTDYATQSSQDIEACGQAPLLCRAVTG